ncbi:MAG: putative Ig domain-containing protein [Planctomycetaceae bacterium]
MISSISNKTIAAGKQFRLDVNASDPDGDPIFYSLTTAPEGAIIDDYGRILWNTDNADVGTHPVTVTVTDILGVTASRSFNITVNADTQAPFVNLYIDTYPNGDLGTDVRLQLYANDNVGIASKTLTLTSITVNGDTTLLNRVFVLDSEGWATFRLDQIGTLNFEGTAVDLAGNVGNATPISLQVVDPNDVLPPTVNILLPDSESILTEPTDVIGSVNDDIPASVNWTLTLSSLDGSITKELATGTGAVTNGLLGNIDTTLLPNGTYALTLEAIDNGAHYASETTYIEIQGALKLGNFSVSFLDLEVPVAGIPITITRTYDTLNANKQGDFGYGWTLDISNVQVDIDWVTGEPERSQLGGDLYYPQDTRIVVTMPDGSTEGFTLYYQPDPTYNNPYTPVAYWNPKFQSDSGNQTELVVPYTLLEEYEGEMYIPGTLNAYNPTSPEFGGGFTLKYRNGTELFIDGDDLQLSTIKDRDGNKLIFTDNGITSNSGRGVEFERDQAGRIKAVIDPLGNHITYTYDVHGDLIAVTDRVEATTQFTYLDEPGDPAHYLDEIIAPNGVPAARSEYDEDGRLLRVIDADGQTIEFEYDTDLRKEIRTDQLDYEWTTYYDDRGNIIREEDPLGGIVIRTYNDNDLMLTETQVIGLEDNATNGETDDLTTTYTYTADGDLKTQTDNLGNKSQNYYNSDGDLYLQIDTYGNRTTYSRTPYGSGYKQSVTDPFNNTTTITQTANGAGDRYDIVTDPNNKNTFIYYNSYGDVIRTEGPLGSPVEFEFDDLGQQVGTSYTWVNPDNPTDQRLLESTSEYDDSGRVYHTIDAQGRESWTYYNGIGQVSYTTDDLGRNTYYLYDARGQVLMTVNFDGSYSASVFDAKGRSTHSVSVNGEGASRGGTQSIYDALDRVTTSQQVDGLTIGLLDANSNPVTFSINASGVLVDGSQNPIDLDAIYSTEVSNAGTIDDYSTTVYDDISGRMLISTNSDGDVTTYEYNDKGQQSVVERTSNGVTTRTEYEYDEQGRSKITRTFVPDINNPTADPEERVTTYEYNAKGRQYKTTDRHGLISLTTYNDDGRVDTQTSYDGTVTKYYYDGYGRQYKTDVTQNGETRTTKTAFDSNGNRSEMIDPLGRITLYAYDEFGRLVSMTQAVGGIDGSVGYESETDDLITQTYYDEDGNVSYEINQLGLRRDFEYDDEGRLTAVILPEVEHPVTSQMVRPRYEYTYDEYGNQTSIRDNVVQINDQVFYDHDDVTGDDTRVTTFTYNEFNQRISRTLPTIDNTLTETFTYDDDFRSDISTDFEGNIMDSVFSEDGLLEELRYFAPGSDPELDPPSETVTYTYDDLNRKTSMTDDRGTTNYSYDIDGRLTQIDSPEGIINYEYDEITGRKTRTTTEGTGNNITNDFQYTYDGWGRLQTVEVHEQNDTVLASPEITTYTYDLLGNLVLVYQPNGTVTEYTYDELYRLDKVTHYYGDVTPGDLSDNQKLAEYDYTVRADGKRTAVTETRWEDKSQPGNFIQETFSWTYDNLGRLIQETYDSADNNLDYITDFTFDLVGNRLTKELDYSADDDRDESITYTYNDRGQLLTETKVVGDVDDGVNLETNDRVTTYSYTGTLRTGKLVEDSSGNDLQNITFGYNLQGRMDEVITDYYDANGDVIRKETTTYQYNDQGIRVEATNKVEVDHDSNPATPLQIESDETTTYLNDPGNFTGYNQVLEEVTYDNLAQAEKDRTIYTLGLDIISQFRVNVDYTAGFNAVFHYDGHGSTRMLTDMTAPWPSTTASRNSSGTMRMEKRSASINRKAQPISSTPENNTTIASTNNT